MYQYIDELVEKKDFEGLKKEELHLQDILSNYRVELSHIIQSNYQTQMCNTKEIERKINDTLEELDYLQVAKSKVFEILHTPSCV